MSSPEPKYANEMEYKNVFHPAEYILGIHFISFLYSRYLGIHFVFQMYYKYLPQSRNMLMRWNISLGIHYQEYISRLGIQILGDIFFIFRPRKEYIFLNFYVNETRIHFRTVSPQERK